MISVLLVLAGVALAIGGFVAEFGPWAAVAGGAVVVVLGLLVPWEEVASAESVEPPPP